MVRNAFRVWGGVCNLPWEAAHAATQGCGHVASSAHMISRNEATVGRLWDVKYFAAKEKRSYPLQVFVSFADAARRNTEAILRDNLVRRDVAHIMNGLTEFLELERKRVPGKVLAKDDRLECMFFAESDPHFDGSEPPGL